MERSQEDRFLQAVAQAVAAKKGPMLRDLMRVEPQLNDSDAEWFGLGEAVRQRYAASSADSSKRLEARCEKLLPAEPDLGSRADSGYAWPSFIQLCRAYLEFWRDVDFNSLVDVHRSLSSLVNQCINALGDSMFGYLVLPTTANLATSITRLAISLSKSPKLSAQRTSQSGDADDVGSKQTQIETTAELLQRALRACFQDRTSIGSAGGGQRTKKQGIYVIVNLTMKLLFQCRRTSLVARTIPNITSNSPALSLYPKSQQVTYLYYLGRFHFSTSGFRWALEALQTAYNLCPVSAFNQRRLILVHLITVSVILGRLPSRQLMAKPEAQGLDVRFAPLCVSIKQGNLSAFHSYCSGSQSNWLRRRGLLLPIRNRCEILVWRSLCRRVFLINGSPGDQRRAPTMDLADVFSVAVQMYSRVPDAVWMYPELTSLEVESVVMSLVEQGFLRGFVSHKQQRFAIQRGGDKEDSHTATIGFPPPWNVTSARAAQRGDPGKVPGWVKEEQKRGGMVIQLASARPAGSSAS